MNQKGISSILIILIIVGVLVMAGGIWAWQSQKEKPMFCTQDTKLCPDGSYVSRTGPNCEFATCPEVKDETADWKTYRNEKYGFEVKYPPTLRVWENQQSGKVTYAVSFDNPSSDSKLVGRKIVFNVSIYSNATQLQDAFGANSDPYRLRIVQGETALGEYQAQKILFKPKDPNDVEATVYLIDQKSTAIIVFGTVLHKISEADIDQILSTFKFTK